MPTALKKRSGRTKAADELAAIVAENGPAAKKLRKAIDRTRLRRACLGERIPWSSVGLIQTITKGRVKVAWWSVAAVGPRPCLWPYRSARSA